MRGPVAGRQPRGGGSGGGIAQRRAPGGIFGIGASGILAEYTARLFSRIGLPAYVMNRTGFSLAEQLIGLQRGDVLIMMGQRPPSRRVDHPARGEAAGYSDHPADPGGGLALQPGGAGGDRRPARRGQ